MAVRKSIQMVCVKKRSPSDQVREELRVMIRACA